MVKILEYVLVSFFVVVFLLALYNIVAISTGLPMFPAHIPGLY